jgi:hypothetical protein
MPRIDVSELREYAAGLRGRGEELRDRTAHIGQLFLSLADDNAWNDDRYTAFQLKFEEKTLRATEFAERIGQYADWLERLADDVEANWGDTLNVS